MDEGICALALGVTGPESRRPRGLCDSREGRRRSEGTPKHRGNARLLGLCDIWSLYLL